MMVVMAWLGGVWFSRSRRGGRGNRLALACLSASAMVAVLGLLSVDPAFPAKRVHVVEYFALAALVFAAFRSTHHLGQRALIALVVAAMLGGLDEMLQGALAERTYGLADMLTNTLGAFAGALAACGVHFLRGRVWGDGFSWAEVAAPLALAAGYFLSLAALYPFAGLEFPLWAALPVVGGLVVVAKRLASQSSPQDILRFHTVTSLIATTALAGGIYVQIMAIHFI